MTDSLMLDSAGVRAVIATVVAASVAASHVRPTNVSDNCVTRDFRDYVGDLESTWRDESLATGEYLHEFARVLRSIAQVMSAAEEELARQAGNP